MASKQQMRQRTCEEIIEAILFNAISVTTPNFDQLVQYKHRIISIVEEIRDTKDALDQ